MNETVDAIPLSNLALSFIPAIAVLLVLRRWTGEAPTAVYGLGRMVGQLLLVGYVLTFIFGSDQPAVVIAVLTTMLLIASWIALRPIQRTRRRTYPRVLFSIAFGGLSTLVLVTYGVLGATPWYQANVVIPLAGMIFAMSMNTVSLAAERYDAEITRGIEGRAARPIAFRAALIPQINSLFAVGLVSLPGMMTGQILSGVPPLVAVRYQIMVMSMMFGATGLATACYLWLETRPAARPTG
jgi:putative ABC transport system permease protein